MVESLGGVHEICGPQVPSPLSSPAAQQHHPSRPSRRPPKAVLSPRQRHASPMDLESHDPLTRLIVKDLGP